MTALRRMRFGSFGGLAAAVALGLGTPALSQDSDAPVDVTAAPPPSAETIGPSQLRDFNLKGTVTRPADRAATTPAQPTDTATAAPRSGEAVPAEAAAPSGAPIRSVASRRPAPAVDSPATPANGRVGSGPPLTPSLPLEVTTDPAPQPAYDDADLATRTAESDGGLLSWSWLAALIALIGGGAFLAWTRRDRNRRYDDPGRMAFAGLAPAADPGIRPVPPVGPRPDPVPPRSAPQADPRPDPLLPQTGPKPAWAPAGDGTIVSTSLKPQLNVEFQPDRVVVTEQELLLMFDLVIINVGSAPARDLLVESRLFTAHFAQDREIATFFQSPTAAGDRMASVAPLGRVSLKSLARLPLEEIHQFEAGGRKLFVPMVGLNILYRYGSSEGQASASYLVGRGGEEDEKLAPFRIDLRPRIFRDLSARPHSLGMQPA